MHTMHPTVLVGPADWDAAVIPREEFAARIAALWQSCDADIAGVAVHGSPRHHAELAYLTHFTPKLQPALALIPRLGVPRLLVGGGVNMVPAAKPLTWIEDVAPLRNVDKILLDWGRQLSASRLAMIGLLDMSAGLWHRMFELLHETEAIATIDLTDTLRLAMRRKSARELALIRQACALLDIAVGGLRSARAAGKGVTDTILAAEEAAYAAGAQDVRTLFGPDGGSALRPFSVPIMTTADPLGAYIAVRHCGYWAEGFVVLADRPNPRFESARTALRHALPFVRAGVRRSDLNDAAAYLFRPDAMDQLVPRAVTTMGLSPDDDNDPKDTLLAGEVISLRAGVVDFKSLPLCSAMILVGDGGHEVLWEQS